MDSMRLAQLLGEFATAHPLQALSELSAISFALWYAERRRLRAAGPQ